MVTSVKYRGKGAMKNPDAFHMCPPSNDGNADQYLGDPDQIENLLGELCLEAEGASRDREHIGPKPQEEINSVPEKSK